MVSQRERGSIGVRGFLAGAFVAACLAVPLGAVEISLVTPSCIRSADSQEIIINGQDFDDGFSLTVGGTPVEYVLASSTELQILAEGLPLGLHDLTLTWTSTAPPPPDTEDTLVGGLRIVGVPQITSIEACILSNEGGQRIRINGRNFCPHFEFEIPGLTSAFTDVDWVSESRFDATTLPVGVGLQTVQLYDGAVLLDTASVEYQAPSLLPQILAVSPSLLLEGAVSFVDFRVINPPAGATIWIGDREQRQLDSIATGFSGTIDRLPAGVYDVRLVRDGQTCALMADSLTILPAVEELSVTPSDVSTEGGTEVEIRAFHLHESTTFLIEGFRDPLETEFFFDVDAPAGARLYARATVPPSTAGLKSLTAIDSRGQFEFSEALNYVPPSVVIASVEPATLETTGTDLAIIGSGFTAGMSAFVGGQALENQVFVSDTRIEGRSPPLAVGVYAVSVAEPRTELARLEDAVTVVEPPMVLISAVTPSELPLAGGLISLRGMNFAAGQVPRIGGQPLLNPVLVTDQILRGTTPALAAGRYDVTITVGGDEVARLPNAVEVFAPPRVTEVIPGRVLEGDEVTIIGQHFRAGLTVRFGNNPVDRLRVDSSTQATGTAPAGTPGPVNVRASDTWGQTILPNGVVYEEPPRAIFTPAPQEFETSLAEGTARFRWVNPVSYSRIEVRDRDGALVTELAGDARTLEMDVGVLDRLDLNFVGVQDPGGGQEDRFSNVRPARALRIQCTRPAPLAGSGVRGKLEFHLYGGPEPEQFIPPEDDRFFTGPVLPNGLAAPKGAQGAPGAGQISLYSLPAVNGAVQPSASIGYVQSEEVLTTIAPQFRFRNKLTTGFILKKPASKLEIAAFYAKIATAADLDLKGRITLVRPEEEGQEEFSHEFTFPDILVTPGLACEDSGADGAVAGSVIIPEHLEDNIKDRGQDWNCTIVFRGETDPDPDDPCIVGEILEFPAGEYLLDIFVVGGDRFLPYYIFTDDINLEELLIPGVPCPPYPLARVTDMTGLRTLPVVTDIEAVVENVSSSGLEAEAVRFLAAGSWFDAQGECHSIDPQDESYQENAHFEYTWTFPDLTPPYTKKVAGHELLVPIDYGCYRVDLTVSDKACGISKTRSFEVPVLPLEVDCPQRPFDFLFPTPDPAGIYGVIGLSDVPNGNFESVRRLEVRVLVSPKCPPASICPELCPAARIDPCNPNNDDFEVRLAYAPHGAPDARIEFYRPLVFDLCPDNAVGPKYFHVIVPDLADVPEIAVDQLFFTCYLQARATDGDNGDDDDDDWTDVTEEFTLFNPPSALEDSLWTGYFEPGDKSYHFQTKSSEDTQTEQDGGETAPFDIMGLVTIPPKTNVVGSGFTSCFQMVGGQWSPETGVGTSSGTVMANELDLAPNLVEPNIASRGMGAVALAGAGPGALEDALSDLRYEWCTQEVLFANNFSENLFNSIIYTGSIGPVPVTIWASIGLSLNYCVEAFVTTFVEPFAGLQGQEPARANFYLLSGIQIAIPCEVRADIAGGIVNVSIGLRPEARFEFDLRAGVAGTTPLIEHFIGVWLKLTMYFRGCIDLLLAEACLEKEFLLFDKRLLLNQNLIDEASGCLTEESCEDVDLNINCDGERTCSSGSGSIAGTLDAYGFQVISGPSLDVHPDGTRIGSYALNESEGVIYVDDEVDGRINNSVLPLGYRDASAAWTGGLATETATEALVSWSKSQPIPQELLDQLPENLADAPLALRNQLSRLADISISRVGRQGVITSVDTYTLVDGEETPIADRRADGRSAITGSLPHNDALVAWVRYETPNLLVVDGVTSVRKRVADLEPGEVCLGTVSGEEQWCWVEVPNVRPAMEETAIYVRRTNGTGPLDTLRKISPPGINIEPAIDMTADGEHAICVWVHDPTHTSLITQNTGRNLFYSLWDRATDTWTPAAPVLGAGLDPDAWPGLLQPSVTLSAPDQGYLVFTALAEGSDSKDTGLGGGSRFVYLSRYIDGVFQEPELIHGVCNKIQYGEWAVIGSVDIPLAVNQLPYKLREPCAVILFHGTGRLGSQESAGDIMTAVIGDTGLVTEAQSVTPESNIVLNPTYAVGAGAMHGLQLNAGDAFQGAGAFAGGARGSPAGAPPPSPRWESMTCAFEPDLLVESCRLSEQFPGPGAFVDVKVQVRNRGFAGSPTSVDTDESLVGLLVFYIDEEGESRLAARVDVPELQPAESTQLDFSIEMPHDPVTLRVQLDSPVDRDTSNDSASCFFGAPAPQQLSCAAVPLPGRDGAQGTEVTWRNTALYDSILVYCDDTLVAELPGRCELYVDVYNDPAVTGVLKYSLRGVIGPSRSARVHCQEPPPPGPGFLRGDASGDLTVDISDAVSTFSYLFSGGQEPGCLRAADSNGSTSVDISDGIFTLGYLFLGGDEPPPPFPTCGEDTSVTPLTCEQPHDC